MNGGIMPISGGKSFADLARRWHGLATRRLAYYDELYRSGRWRHYYVNQHDFALRMLDVVRAAKIWAELAGKSPAAKPAPASKPSDKLRSAA
jgi:hypothetical protein